MSVWKVEKLFEVEGGEVSGIAVDSHNNVYFTTSQHLYCWKDNQPTEVRSLPRGHKLYSPTLDEATQTLYCCDGGWINPVPEWNSALRISQQTDSSHYLSGSTQQVAAVNGRLFELTRHGELFIHSTRVSGVCNEPIERDPYWMCLATSADRVGVLSSDHITYYNHSYIPSRKTIPKINGFVNSAVVNNDGALIFAMNGLVWLSKGDKMRILFSNLKGVKYLSIDQHGDIYAASDFIVWKITKHSIETISDNPGQWKRLKLFLVGDGGAGKTSTLRWLMKQPFSEIPSRTDGVDITTTELRSWKETSVDIKEHMAHICIQQNIPNEASQHVASVNVQPTEPARVSNAGYFRLRPGTELFQISRIASLVAEPFHAPPSNGNPPEDHLQGFSPQTEPLPAATNELRNSIDQYQEKLLNDELPMTFHIWDFGGQEVYYNTHHFFLTEAAIYLLVMDLAQSTSTLISRLQFWLNSIRSYSAESPIVIIGTHKELITEQEANIKLTSIWNGAKKINNAPSNRHVTAISCKEDDLRLDTQKLLLQLAERETADNLLSLDAVLLHTGASSLEINIELDPLITSGSQSRGSQMRNG